MSRKPRGLRPDEEALWQQVARTTTPMSGRPKPSLLAKSATKKAPAAGPRAPIETFRVGGKTSTAPARHNLAPSVSHRIAETPLRMDKRAFSRMKRGKASPEGRIDLHGMTAAAAHIALTSYLLHAYSDGKRLVLVITGKGRKSANSGPIPTPTGILRHELPDWVSQPPLDQIVLQITQAHQRHGGSGAFYVYLARNR
ncbi:MAG: DNA mismatch repair protein MutS [Silicimonas sp.]|nr:DNA mismatch repair protein MutS [Silicimonas sp.]